MDKESRLGKFDKWGYKNSFSKGELARELTYMNRDYEKLEQQCKKQKEVINNAIEYIEKHTYHDTPKKLQNGIYERGELIIKNDFYIEDLVDILKEVSE